jgi:hypothetical protein
MITARATCFCYMEAPRAIWHGRSAVALRGENIAGNNTRGRFPQCNASGAPSACALVAKHSHRGPKRADLQWRPGHRTGSGGVGDFRICIHFECPPLIIGRGSSTRISVCEPLMLFHDSQTWRCSRVFNISVSSPVP